MNGSEQHAVRNLPCVSGSDSNMGSILARVGVVVVVALTATAATPLTFAPRMNPVSMTIADHLKRDRTTEDIVRAFARDTYPNRGQALAFIEIIRRESRFVHTAVNPDSGAYGLGQALPPSKMRSVAADWRTSEITQLLWVAKYISERYGTPKDALRHHDQEGWY